MYKITFVTNLVIKLIIKLMYYNKNISAFIDLFWSRLSRIWPELDHMSPLQDQDYQT